MTMSKEISLAREYPREGLSTVAGSPLNSEPDYPQFHYSGKKELDLPDEGEMTIKFRKRRETCEKAKDGTHFYECDIEVKSICSVEGDEDDDDVEAPTNTRGNGTAEALDKILATMEKMVEKDEEVHEMIDKK